MKIKDGVLVVQDGRNFYSEASGDLIFVASNKVKDGDIEAAKMARKEFLEYWEQGKIPIRFV